MNLKLVVLIAASVIKTCPSAFADDKNGLDWGIDVNLGHQQQSFSTATAELTSVTFNPLLQVDNWNFSFSLPWYKSQGEYFVNGIRPLLITRCERLDSVTPARLQLLVQRGDITQKQIETCAILLSEVAKLNESHSGVGDISGFARYAKAVSDDGVWNASVGLGYKTDSGDSEAGLGTGTKEVMLDVGISMALSDYFFNIMLGYNMVSSHDDIEEIYSPKNYAYANVDLSKAITNWCTLGANVSAQQAYIEDGESTQSITGYVNFSLTSTLELHLYTSRYNASNYSPTSEVGANISYSF